MKKISMIQLSIPELETLIRAHDLMQSIDGLLYADDPFSHDFPFKRDEVSNNLTNACSAMSNALCAIVGDEVWNNYQLKEG